VREGFDASRWLLFPGLINIHEHLRGSWLPRCGNGPYENSYQWLNELHARPESLFAPARERERVSERHLYELGAYKNLFSGVTTVVDHYRRLAPEVYELPIRVLRDFGREGVLRTWLDPNSFPSFGAGLVDEFRQAVERDRPFIIHIEEGFDSETRNELHRLEDLGVLAPNTVLVHGIGFDDEDVEIVRRHGCHLVWCPATHRFLYGRTGNIRLWLERGINVSIGTDSSLTGALNLLEELRAGRDLYREVFGEPLDPRKLFRMVTANPARALRIDSSLGRIAAGASADLLVLERRASLSPFETLLTAEPKDIVLLLQGGEPRYADEAFGTLFDDARVASSIVNVGGRPKRIIGDPVGLLRNVWNEIGRRFVPEFLPFDSSASEFTLQRE
jgi:cytosine/adenosine deaminase-related metal-dependent hydrolase